MEVMAALDDEEEAVSCLEVSGGDASASLYHFLHQDIKLTV